MNRRLIFFDIDGTLITEGEDKYIPESASLALEKLRENGHICIINTGRPYVSLDDYIKSIKVDGYVCGCGTNIRLGDKVLQSYQLDAEMCVDIVKTLDACRFEWLLEDEHALFCHKRPYNSWFKVEIDDLKNKVTEKISTITPEDYGSVKFVKFVMISNGDADYDTIYQKFCDKMTFIDRGNGMFEVIPKQFSKATGMKFLEDYFGIPHENTIGVGDSPNDLTMLEYAGTAIVMGGSVEKVQKYADYVTTGIKEDGIYNAFVHFGLI